MWPATPSSKPRSANLSSVSLYFKRRISEGAAADILNAAARCCLRYSLSASKLSNLGYERILSFFPDVVFPRAPTLEFVSFSPFRVVAVGVIVFADCQEFGDNLWGGQDVGG